MEQQNLIKIESGNNLLSVQRIISSGSTFKSLTKLGFKNISNLLDNTDKTVRISQLMKASNTPEVDLVKIVTDITNSIKELTGVNRFLPPSGVEFFVGKIIDDYRHLTIADINVFAHKILNGEFGELYENISAVKLVSWFKEYVNERSEEFYHRKLKAEREAHKKAERDICKEGVLRMGDTFGRVAKMKRIKKISVLPYRNIGDYLKRNEIDADLFFTEKSEECNRNLIVNGWDIENIDDDVYQGQFSIFLKRFLIAENRKLNNDL